MIKITEDVRNSLELELSFLKKEYQQLNRHTGKFLCVTCVAFVLLCNALMEILNKSVDNLTLAWFVLGLIGCVFSLRMFLREGRLQNRIRQIESALRTGLIDV